MSLPFASEQSLAQQRLGALQHAALLEIRLLVYQNLFDEVGVVQQINVLRAKAKISDIAKLRRHAAEKSDRIPPKLRQMPDYERILRARRIDSGRHVSIYFARRRSVAGCPDCLA